MPVAVPAANFAAMNRTPQLSLDLSHAAPADRFELWRAGMSALWEIEPMATPGAGAAENFRGTLTGYNCGRLLFGHTRTQAQHFARSARKRAADDLDHFLVQAFVSPDRGGPDAARGIRPGDLYVIDLSRPHRRTSAGFEALNAVVPRDLDAGLTKSLSQLHERIVPRENPLVRLLLDVMRGLNARLPEMTQDQADLASETVIGLMRNGLADLLSGSDAGCPDEPATAQALALAIRRHIEDRLHAPVRVEDITARFNISRSHLYRLFEAEGGVQAHIRERRLKRAMRMLAQTPRAGGTVSDIAYLCGFRSEAHFSKAFRARFGMTPSQARFEAAGRPLAVSHRDTLLGDWLSSL